MQFNRPTEIDGHALYSNSIRCDAFTVRLLRNRVSKKIVGGSDKAIVGLKVVNQCRVPTSARIDGVEAVEPIIDRPENKVKFLVERWDSSVCRGTSAMCGRRELSFHLRAASTAAPSPLHGSGFWSKSKLGQSKSTCLLTSNSPTTQLFVATLSATLCVSVISAFIVFLTQSARRRRETQRKRKALARFTVPERYALYG
ncbi:hypothetical protein Q31b_50090 [Novipirellula aureliae]|uniref:Uncharacterized protein n=1 Tax=Novipirellula aureliae TaxID=2527966 RepID=A0A5C6DLN3_9BACT|nr:hypothetical protein Q31b_50090 [Novipirellula aureliae]